MSQRELYTRTLERARRAVVGFVGQESFMTGEEILELGRQAGLTRGTRLLDLCCGVAGPGLHLVRHTGCQLVGLDRSRGAIALARQRSEGGSRFQEASFPPIPLQECFEVVMMLETMLAFQDRPGLLTEMVRVLEPGGRLVLTFEEGNPLSLAEQQSIPEGRDLWLTPLEQVLAWLEERGLTVLRCQDHTASHAAMATRLGASFRAHQAPIREALGQAWLDDILQAHDRWVAWLGSGRVRKFAMVAVSMTLEPPVT